MDVHEAARLEQRLRGNKNWVKGEDGTWSYRKGGAGAAVGQVAAEGAKPDKARALDGCEAKHRCREGRVAVRVVCVALRRRLLDPDAVAFSMKALTDRIAAALGVDDADNRVAWEWSQQQTSGEEVVIVKIEQI